MDMFQNDLLRKIRGNVIDDEVIEYINEQLQWYVIHKNELLDDQLKEMFMGR